MYIASQSTGLSGRVLPSAISASMRVGTTVESRYDLMGNVCVERTVCIAAAAASALAPSAGSSQPAPSSGGSRYPTAALAGASCEASAVWRRCIDASPGV
eukprot:CAMPEP_0119406858 /NCGR_PEP_ID=MMETSP1335-20130426/1026_1 /TAXON_ID=259385 /ORGANISM="Chrysoculter rhomboideus, Strain RCC1486" /LENGTH=99 /DNA_ID=CAMNT_0007430951 /DNA_START=179 /DNA_END=478 /DNA_ORIENTATION=+